MPEALGCLPLGNFIRYKRFVGGGEAESSVTLLSPYLLGSLQAEIGVYSMVNEKPVRSAGALKLACRVEVFHLFAPLVAANLALHGESRNIIRRIILVLLVVALLVVFLETLCLLQLGHCRARRKRLLYRKAASLSMQRDASPAASNPRLVALGLLYPLRKRT